ncbi:glycosyltransferase family 2 protein [Qipengyuania seohaensis]|uniref:glycosyltransferase family 2 protein n=1 Tax=Qipengyuania seohaensis TaxID=266951 RepID=UPI001E360864|nr:glycosyltransferase family 2 protein [Qipengyuania seohaensis]
MVAKNADETIGAALKSATDQTVQEIEIVVVDDGSSDRTRAIARTHAKSDFRIKIFAGPAGGLAAARNYSLGCARAPWAAILDSDDLLHPRHLEFLLDAVRTRHADLIAANMIEFGEQGGKRQSKLFLEGTTNSTIAEVSECQFVESGTMGFGGPSLGFLKPMISLKFLEKHGVAYDPTLRIGEDYDLIARMLQQGARYTLTPRPTYFYRKHANSTSHRLSIGDIDALIQAARDPAASENAVLKQALKRRKTSLIDAKRHLLLVNMFKDRKFLEGVIYALQHPRTLFQLAGSIKQGILRRIQERVFQGRGRTFKMSHPNALIIGPLTEGTETYLAATTLMKNGYRVVCKDIFHWSSATELSDQLPTFDVILLGCEVADEIAPYALSPDAVWMTRKLAADGRNKFVGLQNVHRGKLTGSG